MSTEDTRSEFRSHPFLPYGDAVRRHLAAPTGVGRLADPSGVGSAGSASCGDLVRIEIDVDRGILREARFQAYGCPATIAGASELIGRIEGRPVLEAAALSEASIARSLGLSARKRACSNLAVDALHGALEAATGRYPALVPEQERGIDERGVLVGMSGGVDSATAALRLREAGYRVVGVTFRLWSDPTCASGRGCCSPETIQSARRTAHALGLPHLTVDLGARFVEEVVDPFVREYAAGRTPNPCVRCNAGLRFAELAGVADRLGLRWISTGHYARMAGVPPRLRRGLDQAKDQSYVLAQVHPRLLERARFPLGELTKAQTRALAREAGLDVHDSAESQEICFIPDNDYRRFLRERLGERPGAIVDLEGAEIGRHKGTYNYTVGQRRGLGIAAPEPLYVRATVPSERVVVVGSAEALQVATVVANEVVVHRHPIPYEGSLQLRSSGLVATAQVHFDESEGAATFALAAPMSGVAAGQAAVLYDRDAVVLAGTICATGKTR